MLDNSKRFLSRYRRRLGSLFDRSPSSNREKDEERSDADSSPTPDPRLTDVLATGQDENFEQVRQDAIAGLAETEGMAIWLQAIGDGTPLDPETDDPIERVTPQNTCYLGGFHDELSYPEIVQAAGQLFAHHAALMIEIPTLSQAQSPQAIEDHAREMLRDMLDMSTVNARQLYAEVDVEDRSTVLGTQSFTDQRDRAIEILENKQDELTAFWVQVMTMKQMVSVSSSNGPSPETGVLSAPSFEYFYGRPTLSQADVVFLEELAMEQIVQHQYVTAQIAEQSLGSIKEQSISIGIENGYIIESIC